MHRSGKLIHKGSTQSGIVIGLATDASGEGSVAEGECTIASGYASHAECRETTASGMASHAEGEISTASAEASHAEGIKTTASGDVSHAEGWYTTASGMVSHAEGEKSTASNRESHAEGCKTTASGNSSHAEGYMATAGGAASHAEGGMTNAGGNFSHAEGGGTIASAPCQHVQGKYNIEDTEGKYVHIVGNGTGDTNRSNCHTSDKEGNAWFAGNVSGVNGYFSNVAEYEEGIWTPEPYKSTSDYILSNGKYIKNGKNVVIICLLSGTLTESKTCTVYLSSSSLPFPLKYIVTGRAQSAQGGFGNQVGYAPSDGFFYINDFDCIKYTPTVTLVIEYITQ